MNLLRGLQCLPFIPLRVRNRFSSLASYVHCVTARTLRRGRSLLFCILSNFLFLSPSINIQLTGFQAYGRSFTRRCGSCRSCPPPVHYTKSVCALSYESARPQSTPNIFNLIAAGLTGGCPTSLDPVGSEDWIGCGRHGAIVSSLPQCKHAGHSVALGSRRIHCVKSFETLWQCDRFKNIGVSPCLSVYSFLASQLNHGHQV
jgi:hypothetical protein